MICAPDAVELGTGSLKDDLLPPHQHIPVYLDYSGKLVFWPSNQPAATIVVIYQSHFSPSEVGKKVHTALHSAAERSGVASTRFLVSSLGFISAHNRYPGQWRLSYR